MSDEYVDPSGSTEAFRAFQAAEPAATQAPPRLPLIIGAAVVAVAVIALAGWLALA
ncbi:hypothetical protein SAMN05444365_101212 [Micromonospora pattaloongensis]|uniref:Uncharacterized protein n=1 Tax=Micromonospora pattaloongensis TaxID=405436 RepID=A0A1H3FZI6_9ACTN|nr:hypothetical protein [Micromonospora pattaloongensis]SDX96187.1 hypothetical protein SAMN05444365_101212 [Micromonospora pattaloongensis]